MSLLTGVAGRWRDAPLARRTRADHVRLCEHIEDANGAAVFRAACNMGLEGIVAKRRDSRYRSRRCWDWIERAMQIALSKRRQQRG